MGQFSVGKPDPNESDLNGNQHLHGKHPRPTPKAVSPSTGRDLPRRVRHRAGAPVAGFVTAVHTRPIANCRS